MFHFGVDYYPEHWPESRWPDDARLMADAGLNVVRLAEFAWARLEPAAGQFEFGWLDKAIDVLAGHGINIVLGTPTASPPPWLTSRYPDLFRILQDGRRVTNGNRREYCPNHLPYQEHCRQMVERMAEHYRQHPAVIGWQIDNEFGDRCYCPLCAAAFQGWLRERFGTLEAVNERWGTVFWSHVYTEWEQIPLPLSTAALANPGLVLDFYRFCSDSYVHFQQQQIDILRAQCPNHFITHNLMGFKYNQINYFDLAQPLDLVSWDNYPRLQWNMNQELDPAGPALGHDTMRGLKQRPFWVMEQQAGPAGWEMVGPTPRPGQLRLWAYQAIAHGADGVVFFRWRTARIGAEQYWHGLLDHHGRPGRRYQEIGGLGAEVAALSAALAGTVSRPSAAMILSYDSRFSFQLQGQNPGFDYSEHLSEIYRTLYDLHIPVDIVSPDADLSAYRLVIAPALRVVDEPTVANLERYAAAGGVLLITAFSGSRNTANQIVDQPLPGLLSELCGVEVEEYDSLPLTRTNAVRFTGADLPADAAPTVEAWCEILQPHAAQVLAVYQHEYYAGRPAITWNQVGDGRVMYVGAYGKQDLFRPLLSFLAQAAQIEPLGEAPEGIEIQERQGGHHKIVFLLNHSDEARSVELPETYHNLIDGLPMSGTTVIGPYDVLILEKQEGNQP